MNYCEPEEAPEPLLCAPRKESHGDQPLGIRSPCLLPEKGRPRLALKGCRALALPGELLQQSLALPESAGCAVRCLAPQKEARRAASRPIFSERGQRGFPGPFPPGGERGTQPPW